MQVHNVRAIKWTRRAVKRIDEIGAYSARENPQSSSRVVKRIVVAFQTPSTQSAIGRPGRITGTREFALADIPYIVVYRMTATKIEILTVMHAAQRWPLTLEFVRERWDPAFPKRQTKTKESRVCLVQTEPDRLYNTASITAPAVIMAMASQCNRLSFSLKNTTPNTATSTIESLSTGATRAASPSFSARK
jgi:toxin ParE1/3/4